jgi:putative ABC transport system permease protein
MVERYWPHQDPIGKHINILPPLSTGGFEHIRASTLEIIGVVPDNPQYSFTNSNVWPEIWIPMEQNPVSAMDIIMRCADADLCARTLRSAVTAMDSDLPVWKTYTIEDDINEALKPQRFALVVLNGCGFFALLISAVGVYAVISYSVAQRTQEIGVRMALGAPSATVLRMVLREGLTLIAVGVGAGVVLALVVSHMVAALLYRVQPRDPLALSAAALLLTAIAVFATYVPARRATQLDPMLALRAE